MASAEQILSQISRMINGDSSFNTTGAGNEFYNTVPNSSGMMNNSLRNAISPGGLPFVPMGMNVNSALQATTNAQQWNQLQNAAYQDTAAQLTNTTNDLLKTLTGKRVKQDAIEKIMPRLAQSSAFKNVMGGDILGSAQELFNNRGMFSATGILDPSDTGERERDVGRAIAFQRTMSQATRSAGGAVNYGYTRGFATDDITRLQTSLAGSGRWGRGLSDTGRHPDIVSETGQYTQAFEALSQATGSNDMATLQQTMSNLTSGKGMTKGFDVEGFKNTIREITATARLLGQSNGQMLQAVSDIQNNLKGTMGVTAGGMALGVTGGGMSGLGAANVLNTRIAESATAASISPSANPEEYNRLANRQMALYAMGATSTGGKAAQAAAYLHQNKQIDDADYATIQAGLVSPNKADRNSAYSLMNSRSGGLLPMLMTESGSQAARETLDEEHGKTATANIMEGTASGAAEVMSNVNRSNSLTTMRALQTVSGIQSTGDMNSAGQYTEIIKQLKATGGDAAAGVLSAMWDNDTTSTPLEKIKKIKGRLSSSDMARFAPGALKAADTVSTQSQQDYLLANVDSAAAAQSSRETLRNSLSGLNPEDRKYREGLIGESAALTSKGRHDEALAVMTNGNIDPATRALIKSNQEYNQKGLDSSKRALRGSMAAEAMYNGATSNGLGPLAVFEETTAAGDYLDAAIKNKKLAPIRWDDTSVIPKDLQDGINAAINDKDPTQLASVQAEMHSIQAAARATAVRAEAAGIAPPGSLKAVQEGVFGSVSALAIQQAAKDQGADDAGAGARTSTPALLLTAAGDLDPQYLAKGRAQIAMKKEREKKANYEELLASAAPKIDAYLDDDKYGVRIQNALIDTLDPKSAKAMRRYSGMDRAAALRGMNIDPRKIGEGELKAIAKLPEPKGSKKSGGGGKDGGGAMELTGTLKLEDSSGRPMGNMNIRASGVSKVMG